MNAWKSDFKLEIRSTKFKAFSSDGVPLITGSKGGVAAKLRENQSLKHLLNVHYISYGLPYWPVQTQVTTLIFEESELTLTQLRVFSNNSPKTLNDYLKTAHKMHNMVALRDNKRKNVIEK